jgi:hypothetical protein
VNQREIYDLIIRVGSVSRQLERAFEDGHLKQETSEQVQMWLSIARNNLSDSAKGAKR